MSSSGEKARTVLKIIWNFRSTLLLVLLPILLLPIPLVLPNEYLSQDVASCMYCIIIIAVYWITEVLPPGVTALLPLILFPLMGIMKASEVSVSYLTNTNWLMCGGLMIAVGVEHTGLHKRIAMRTLLAVGSKPHSLMIGCMIPTYILSMWISNTATTAMMIPIIGSILGELSSENQEIDEENNQNQVELSAELEKNSDIADELHEHATSFSKSVTETVQVRVTSSDNAAFAERECSVGSNSVDHDTEVPRVKVKDQCSKNFNTGLSLCVPYAATIGGITTITGTGPNAVLVGQYEILFPCADPPLTFGNWMAYHFPISLSLLVFAYFWLAWFYLGINFKVIKELCHRGRQTERDKRVIKVIKEEYSKLGKIRWSEVTVLTVFVTTALLWLFRNPGFISGWSVLFKDGYVTDATVAMTMAILLFFLPSKRPMFLVGGRKIPGDMKPVPPVLDWPTAQRMFPWEIMLLLGGGFAMADGAVVSGFSDWLGVQLSGLGHLDPWVLCLIVSTIISLFTEVTSNVATASLFVPIMAALAQNVGIHPLYLMLPTTVATSLAFMLPVATAPNAIAFSYGHVRVIDLVKAGWVLNVLGIILLLIFVNTYADVLFGVNEFPTWASVNFTGTPPECNNTV